MKSNQAIWELRKFCRNIVSRQSLGNLQANLLGNKIVGTPILKLAIFKRLQVKNFVKKVVKKIHQKKFVKKFNKKIC